MADCIKARYPNRWAASQALHAIRGKVEPGAGKVPKALYPCQKCGCWHLTSKKLSGQPRRWEVLAR